MMTRVNFCANANCQAEVPHGTRWCPACRSGGRESAPVPSSAAPGVVTLLIVGGFLAAAVGAWRGVPVVQALGVGACSAGVLWVVLVTAVGYALAEDRRQR